MSMESPLGRTLPLNQPMKVLIVDDEASQRSGLAAMVSAWGMTPETAGDGNEALLKLNDFPGRCDPDRPEHAGHGRLRLPATAARFRRNAAHHRAHRLRQRRNGREDGPRTGRLLVSREADSARQPGSADPPRRQPRRPARREAQPGAPAQLQGLAGRTGRHLAEDAGDFCPAAAGRTEQGLRADHRRERHRQRNGGPHAARAEPAAAGTVHRHQLRGAAGDA